MRVLNRLAAMSLLCLVPSIGGLAFDAIKAYAADTREIIPIGFFGFSNFPLDSWKANMEDYGQKYCDSGDNYYDAARVYYQIADYTGRVQWTRCAENVVKAYRDGYLKPNRFAAAGWMIFPHGL